jgi:hypothetical protein
MSFFSLSIEQRPYLPDANLTGTKAMASAAMPLEP